MSEPKPTKPTLSEREIEILTLVSRGKSNKEIARELHLSPNTVKVHLRNIFGKLEVSSRTEASSVAMRTGVIGSINAVEEPVNTQPIELDTTRPRSPISRQNTLILGIVVVVAAILFGVTRLVPPDPPATPVTTAGQFSVENRWEENVPLPAARVGSAAVPLNDSIYIIGGATDGIPNQSVLRFDPGVPSLTGLSQKPSPVRDINAAILGGRIYVPGGLLASGEPTDRLEIYDPAQDSWSLGSSLPISLSAYSMVSFEGELYVFGGWSGDGYVDRVFSYSPVEDIWVEREPMPKELGFSGAVVSGGRIFIIGGHDGVNPVDDVWLFSPSRDRSDEDRWSSIDPLPEPRYAMGVVSVAEKIHLIGGIGGETASFSQMEYSSGETGWKIFETPLADRLSNFGVSVKGAEIFVFGGDLGGQPTERIFSYRALYIVILPVIEN